MSFTTYNDHTIHDSDCDHLRKHGGSEDYEYEKFDTLEEAEQSVMTQGNRPEYCSDCMN